MRSTNSCLFLVLLLAFGCRQDGGKTAEEAPKTLEEYTQAIIKEVRRGILTTDQQLREYQPQQLEFPAEKKAPHLSLQLWKAEGNPVKLTATTADGPQTAFYFANGELFYATRPDAGFVFIDQQLKYWLDENWQPVQVEEVKRKEMQKELLEQAEGYLWRFTAQND